MHQQFSKSLKLVSTSHSLLLSGLLLLSTSCSSHSISENQEIAASESTMAWMKQEYGIIEDPEVKILINDIQSRLSRAISESGLSSKKKFSWQVHLVNSATPNAFSAGGGKVFITTGLFKLLGSEAELASVISHEFAHQLLDHPKNAIAKVLKENSSSANQAPSLVYSDQHEIEADRAGLKIMKLAGYDIRHALTALSSGYKRAGHSNTPLAWQTAQRKNPHLDRRLAELFVEVYDKNQLSPSRRSSRQFNKAKGSLSR